MMQLWVFSAFWYTTVMKYLGIDYGTKRVGIATSDDEGSMAFPLCVIENKKNLIEEIVGLCRDERIEKIIVGESNNLYNGHNPIMKEITPFAELLREFTHLPVDFMTEVLTSREAMHIQGDNMMNDASAAAIILQSYLDRNAHAQLS